MNRIYRLAWNRALGCFVPASEVTPCRGKGSSGRSGRTIYGGKRGATALAAAAIVSVSGLAARAGPTGGQIVAGSGTITQSGAVTNISQASQDLSLNWATFNIAPRETVNFVQPSVSAIAVNRIFDVNGTQILGHLNANGQVYLINPNGILFGRGAQVNVGGLVASTLDLSGAASNAASNASSNAASNAALSSSTKSFSGTGSGSVVNEGTITAATGGSVVLLGNRAGNTGVITAELGTVALGAGRAATLTFSGDTLVHMQIDQSVLNSVAQNGGLLHADGGRVIMGAGAKDTLLASVVNNTGVIEARTVDDRGGTITLLGGMAAGTVQVGGTLDASAPNGGRGGAIETSAAHVAVADNAKVSTASSSGLYGSWLVDPQDFTVAASGGDITGAALSNSLATTAVVLQSSAGATAGSGDVNVNDKVSWSANTTLTLTASNNVNVNAAITATGNTAGLVINPNTANGADSASGTGTFQLNNGASINLPGSAPTLFIAGSAYVVINSLGAEGSTTGTDLQGVNGALAGHYALGSNIDASATSAWNGGAGFMPIGTNTAPFTGTFDGLGHAISNLTINLPSMSYVGLFGEVGSTGVIRNTGLRGGSVQGGAYFVGGLVGLNYGTVSNSYMTGPVTGGVNSIGGLIGANYGSVSHSYATGSVNSLDNVGGLVGLNKGNLSTSYATGSVSGWFDVGGLVGFSQTGTGDNLYATGAVNGIANIGGLFGQSNSTVSNSYSTGSVHGSGASIAGLVGNNYGTVNNSYSTGAVSGSSGLGGLVSGAGGTVTNSFWNITTSGQATSLGGTGLTTAQMQTAANFTGFTFTTTPGVTGNQWVMVDADGSLNNAGGALGATFPMLASEYSSAITNAHQLQLIAMAQGASYTLAANVDASATALAVTAGSGDVWSTPGGFVPIANFTGRFDGMGHAIGNLGIFQATTNVGLFGVAGAGADIRNVALVGGSIAGLNDVGALVGLNTGSVSNSYSTADVGGDGTVGGLVGSNAAGTISNSYAVGGVFAASGILGGLAGANSGTISNSYAAGSLTGSTVEAGGLIGANSGTAVHSFWDATLNPVGVGSGAVTGATALTTAGMMTQSNFTAAGWSISNSPNSGAVWRIYDGSTAPLLLDFLTPLTVTASAIDKTYDGVVVAGLSNPIYSAAGADTSGHLFNLNDPYSSAVNAGSYAAKLYSDQQGYDINIVGGALTIDPALLTVIGTTVANKIYDGTVTAALAGGSLSGAIGGDAATLTLAQAGSFASRNAGTGIAVTAHDVLGGASAINYTLTQPVGLAANITPASLTVTGESAVNKVYDGTVTAALTGGSLSGVIAGDAATLSLNQAGVFASKNVGTGIAVTAHDDLGGASAINYVLTQPSGIVADITPATLTYLAAPAKLVMGDMLPGLSGTVSGFVPGDTQSNATTGTLAWAAAAGPSSAPGLYAIDGEGLSAINYVLVQAPANATALQILPPAAPPGPAIPVALIENVLTQLDSILPASRSDRGIGDDAYKTGNGAPTLQNGAPALHIVNGGVKLPANAVDFHE
jgi:filamentous hemagglutinin family protein